MNKIQTKDTLKDTLQLVHKTLYKTIEFQLLFKLFYVSIILFIINFLVNIIFNATDTLLTMAHLSELINQIPIISLFEYKIIFVVLISLFIIAFVYLVEKNTVLILTTEYYRNNFINSSQALFISMQRTPILIFRRLYEMRLTLFIFIELYITWKILIIFTLPQWFTLIFATILIIYGVGILSSLIIRYTFTAFITYSNPNENFKDFNDKLSNQLLHKKFDVVIIFYIIFAFAILLWFLFFYLTVQLLLHFASSYPDYVSTILSFFIAFTIFSILIFFSLFKTIKTSLMTILYYQERDHQNKNTVILTHTKQPILSRSILLALLTIFTITFIGGSIVSSSIKPTTIQILNNAHNYIEQTEQKSPIIDSIQSKNIAIPEVTQKTLSKRKTILDSVEKLVFTFLAHIIDK